MPVLTSNRPKIRQNDFSGGQNSSDDAATIGHNQAQLLQNCIITKKGRCTERNGITKLGTANSTTNVILGLFHFNAGSALDTLLRSRITKIQRLAADYSDWSDIVGLTTLTTGLTTNFVQAIDNCYIMNGTDNVFSIDSSFTVTEHDASNNAKFPKCTFAEWATNNRMFASGSLTSTLRDYVWFSDALAPTTWNQSTNVFKVRSGNGGKVTWLKMFKEFELIIYKNDSIYVLQMDGATPLTDWTLQPLSTVIGCPAGRTVCDIGNDQIYLANDGVRLLSRTTLDKLRIGVISDPIRDIIEAINQDAIATSNGYFENGLYILNVPLGTSAIPNKTLIWDSVAANRNGDPNSAWTTVPTATWNFSCMSSFGFGDNDKTFVSGSSLATSLCYKVLNGLTDDSTAITQQIISRQEDFDYAFLEKVFDPGNFIGEGGSQGIYLIEIRIDDGSWLTVGQLDMTGGLMTPFTTPQTTSAVNDANESFRTKFAGRGHLVEYRITNSVSGKLATFFEYTSFARPYMGRIT